MGGAVSIEFSQRIRLSQKDPSFVCHYEEGELEKDVKKNSNFSLCLEPGFCDGTVHSVAGNSSWKAKVDI